MSKDIKDTYTSKKKKERNMKQRPRCRDGTNASVALKPPPKTTVKLQISDGDGFNCDLIVIEIPKYHI
jgi:hypothetical protein